MFSNHKRLQEIEVGDENHNETKKLETLCINFLEKDTPSTNENSENALGNDCIITCLKRNTTGCCS